MDEDEIVKDVNDTAEDNLSHNSEDNESTSSLIIKEEIIEVVEADDNIQDNDDVSETQITQHHRKGSYEYDST